MAVGVSPDMSEAYSGKFVASLALVFLQVTPLAFDLFWHVKFAVAEAAASVMYSLPVEL
jgi:hypothetical protein